MISWRNTGCAVRPTGQQQFERGSEMNKAQPLNIHHLMGVLLTCLLAACARENHEHFITSGEDYLAKKDYPAAIIQFKNAVQKVPDNGQARYLLGTALRGSGELRSAEIEFRKA